MNNIEDMGLLVEQYFTAPTYYQKMIVNSFMKIVLDELKDQRDSMARLEKSMAELIGGDNDSND